MNAGLPFSVCSWRSDFMECLLEQALNDTGGDVSSAVFIFPHSRPEKYLSRLLRRDERVRRPLIAPQCLTVNGLFSAFRTRIFARSAWNAGLLDRVGLLLECVRQESGTTERVFAPQLTDARHFFPWGVRLASLFEECFAQHRKPDNFSNTGGQVSPFAEMLLARLAQIFTHYAAGLAEREWTTPGFDASLAADWLREHEVLPPGLIAGSTIYIAGFHALTGTEDLLFRHLWEQHGSRVMIHADPALAEVPNEERAGQTGAPRKTGRRPVTREIQAMLPYRTVQEEQDDLSGRVHWSCRAFIDWAERWKAQLEPVPARTEYSLPETDRTAGEEAAPRRIRYYQGFDLHSQLTVLERELADLGESLDDGIADPGQGVAPEREESAGDDSFSAEDGLPEEELARDQAADTVVVLPDSGLLMPVLHHLPETNINISMGYPLSRSPLFRLLDTLARLQEGRRGEGYYWRDLGDLVRHPYITMLLPLEENPEDAPQGRAGRGGTGPHHEAEDSGDRGSRSGDMALRRELYRLEQALHGQGRKYARPRELLEQAYLMLPPDEMPPRPVLALLDSLLEVCLENFEAPRTPHDLGQALEGVCSLLLRHGGQLWKRFLIDAECLYRLMQSLIPELCHSQLAREPFPAQTLFAMLRRLMEAERVPFEATPLVGLQVMGMLETRLLSFRRVVVLDAGEDALPGAPAADPLLPEALRPELGLPPLHSREQVAAYHFFRLIAGAKDVILLWQEGTDSPGIQEAKKKKSRFIEELLWEEEKRLGRLLDPKERGGDGPLSVLASSVAPIRRERRSVPITPGVRALVRSLLERPVSASLLDSYLRCPVRFFYERLARLAPAEEISEGDDPVAVGELFHQTLHDAYSQHPPGSPLPGGEELAAAMGPELTATLHASPAFAALSRSLPADSFAMLGCAGGLRLERYLERQPPSTVLALEHALAAPFARDGLSCTLAGKADRIDLRRFPTAQEEDETVGAPGDEVPGIVILDYKTGKLPFVSPGLWDNHGLWRRLRDWRPGPVPEDGALLQELARLMESVQLPFYLLLHLLSPAQSLPAEALSADGHPVPGLDAAWVSLGDGGEERALFPPQFSHARRCAIVSESIPDLVHFLLRHMLTSHEYFPHPAKHCDWCSCAKLCMLSSPLV